LEKSTWVCSISSVITPLPAPHPDTAAHFDEVASQAPAASLGSALSSMFRSNATPSFGQTVGNLFGQSNPEQRAGILNQMIQSMGPAALAAGGGLLSKILGNNAAPAGTPPTISPAQAAQVAPADVSGLATHAEQHNPSIVDTAGAFYAQHPALVKTLGVAALAVAMGQMQKARA
jgi:hypothetical protein